MDLPISSPVTRTASRAATLAAVVWTAASAYVTFTPFQGERLRSPADYADPLLLLLGVATAVVALTGLQRHQERRAGWVGQVGYWLTVAALAAMAVQATAFMATGNEATLGPLYPLGALLSRLGLIVWAVAAYRAAVLPRWLGPALALTWLLAPPLGPAPTLFAFAAVWAAAAVALWWPASVAEPAPAL